MPQFKGNSPQAFASERSGEPVLIRPELEAVAGRVWARLPRVIPRGNKIPDEASTVVSHLDTARGADLSGPQTNLRTGKRYLD